MSLLQQSGHDTRAAWWTAVACLGAVNQTIRFLFSCLMVVDEGISLVMSNVKAKGEGGQYGAGISTSSKITQRALPSAIVVGEPSSASEKCVMHQEHRHRRGGAFKCRSIYSRREAPHVVRREPVRNVVQ